MTGEFCIADTEYGQVRGAKVISEVGIPYWRFLGIPYAKPPVGELRFQVKIHFLLPFKFFFQMFLNIS